MKIEFASAKKALKIMALYMPFTGMGFVFTQGFVPDAWGVVKDLLGVL